MSGEAQKQGGVLVKKSDFDWLEDRPGWVKNAYALKLEVEYRRTSGISFQLLFDRVMRSIHGEDYTATATYGNQGDLGCDGILKSRKTHFAIYGPSPYFKLKEAQKKMRGDFARMLECWQVPKQVRQWVFVVNYPGVHPSLLSLAQELEESQPGLKVFVWSRYDLTQQLLAYARMDLILSEFGAVEEATRRLSLLTFVPEDTSLPSEQAMLNYKRLRARLASQKDEYEKLTDEWLEQVGEDTWSWFLVHTQFLIGVMATAAMANAFLPQSPPVNRLKFEASISDYAWRKYFKTAWGVPAIVILKEDYTKEVPPIGDDLERLWGVCLVQDALALSAIRVTSRLTGMWETDVLEEAWSYVTSIKIHDDEVS
ncbi:hypothetical protein ACH4ZU_35955 [Streptomyces sp. NPDC020472]|uniref:hypothetical protein n=1 Tax=Streptomyces sp. NPDC020472 TaxID=3365075 RepID=UPI0037B5CAA7